MPNAGLSVAVHQFRVLHVVEVYVWIDELQLFHEPISQVEAKQGAVLLKESPRFRLENLP